MNLRLCVLAIALGHAVTQYSGDKWLGTIAALGLCVVAHFVSIATERQEP